MKTIKEFFEFTGVVISYFMLLLLQTFSSENLKKAWDIITDLLILIILFVVIAGIYFTFNGCSIEKRQAYHCKRCPKSDSTVTVTNTFVRDSIITIPADQSWLRMYLSCDSLYNVIIKDTAGKSGTKTVIKYKLVDNIITVTCNVDSGTVVARYVSKHTKTVSKTTQGAKPPVNTFKSFLQWSGGILWLLLIIIALIWATKKIILKK